MMDDHEEIEDELDVNTVNTLKRKQHIKQLIDALTGVTGLNEILVPVQCWTVYWITHSLSILEQQRYLNSYADDVIKFIGECAHPDGGYGGGPGQIAHIATTFASVNALITTSSETALDSIDRLSLLGFLRRMKQPDGSFTMHDDGEIDSRATYCALAVLRCLNIQDCNLLENVADWIISCQTYEGGFGSVPGCEAHGGYTFCCVASLCLLNQLHRVDIHSLLRWLTNKQLTEDGGFCGRSNKLVDSCYSYWQGAVFPLLHPYLNWILGNSSSSSSSGSSSSEGANHHYDYSRKQSENAAKSNSSDDSRMGDKFQETNDNPQTDTGRTTRSTTAQKKRADREYDLKEKISKDTLLNDWIFDEAALQDYVLNKCQAKAGLLRDKPGAPPDYYHTCYALSGLSISQHQPNSPLFDLGSQQINQLAPISPLFNLTLDNLDFCFQYFKDKKIETFQEGTDEVTP